MVNLYQQPENSSTSSGITTHFQMNPFVQKYFTHMKKMSSNILQNKFTHSVVNLSFLCLQLVSLVLYFYIIVLSRLEDIEVFVFHANIRMEQILTITTVFVKILAKLWQ